ncbi:MAG: hypothetical protein JSR91_04360 [Proteobacteria bacterium]|nr:hypothetical protein [Pseudomonadota bacterium]
MVRSKRLLSILAAAAAANLVGCYPLRPYEISHSYSWNRQTFDYRPPINTWAEDPRMAQSLKMTVERRRSKTPDQSDADIVASILEDSGFRCVSRREPPGCRECQTCGKVETGYASSAEMPEVDGRRQAMGKIETMVYVGPGSAVRVLTYWKRPPVQLQSSP